MIGHRADHPAIRDPDAHRHVTAIRAELHGVVEEVDEDLGEPRLVAADRRQLAGDVDPQRDALPVGEESQALGRFGRDLAHVDEVDRPDRPAALDPRQVQQLADHLDQVAGLDLDLADPIAHLGRNGAAGGLGLAGQRLGQQADRRERRPQLMGQVVDELRPDLLEATQLGDVLQDQPRAAGRRSLRPNEQPAAVGLGSADLSGRRTLVDRAADDRLDLGVEEGLDHGPPDQRALRPLEERVRRAVRPDDAESAIDRDHALGQRLDQQVVVVAIGRELVLEPAVLAAQGRDGADRIRGRCRTGDGAHPGRGSPAPDRGRRDDQERKEGEERSESDQPGLHGASIAQPRAARAGAAVSPPSGAEPSRPANHRAPGSVATAPCGPRTRRAQRRGAAPAGGRSARRERRARAWTLGSRSHAGTAAAASRAASDRRDAQRLVVVGRRPGRPGLVAEAAPGLPAWQGRRRRQHRASRSRPMSRRTAWPFGP